MNNKLVIGLVIAAAGAAFLFKDKLFPQSAGSSGGATIYPDGTVLVAPDSKTYYKIVQGKKAGYSSWQAYLNDGQPTVYTITPEEMKAIPSYPKGYIDETGFKVRT